ncbi:hypothetical protein BP00DRAFT_427960 [Aspergillus indologenus CBS 114.80]|uniref:Secreted protein n=1 Tax=Aspergillus indologenus CBS 114.80 TaxID=1450541 RepID=A0A2V5HWT5_9EURO|nr:hypothetical protein BP00DRAFT_427960 [Aspergillus indologenus CBS 114.80]
MSLHPFLSLFVCCPQCWLEGGDVDLYSFWIDQRNWPNLVWKKSARLHSRFPPSLPPLTLAKEIKSSGRKTSQSSQRNKIQNKLRGKSHDGQR